MSNPAAQIDAAVARRGQPMNARANWRMRAVAIAFLAIGIVLSHRIEPGIHVKALTLAGDTPALEFQPAASGPHPVALLAHGVTASKETLFRFGEGLAAAGFACYAVDLPGHGASTRSFSPVGNVRTLEEIARTLGSVDVFVGHSMGAGAGAAAVRDAGLSPKLFIAAGALPTLGEQGPPLLLLAGKFEEFFAPNRLTVQTDTRLVISPWSDHALEPFDPRLVNAGVEAACAAVGLKPPAAPTCWRWRLAGLALGMLGAFGLAFCFPKLPLRMALMRGPLISGLIIVAFVLASGKWCGAAPHLRRIPMQIVAMAIVWLALKAAGSLRLQSWILMPVTFIIAIGCAMGGAPLFSLLAALLTLVLLVGTAIGRMAAHQGSRRDGDLGMAIFVGYAIGQCLPTFY